MSKKYEYVEYFDWLVKYASKNGMVAINYEYAQKIKKEHAQLLKALDRATKASKKK